MNAASPADIGGWLVYILRCSDGSLYTGITTDIDRRIAEHGNSRGAKYCRGREPLELAYLESGHDRSSASRREAAIKALSRVAKERLIAEDRDPLGRDYQTGSSPVGSTEENP